MKIEKNLKCCIARKGDVRVSKESNDGYFEVFLSNKLSFFFYFDDCKMNYDNWTSSAYLSIDDELLVDYKIVVGDVDED